MQHIVPQFPIESAERRNAAGVAFFCEVDLVEHDTGTDVLRFRAYEHPVNESRVGLGKTYGLNDPYGINIGREDMFLSDTPARRPTRERVATLVNRRDHTGVIVIQTYGYLVSNGDWIRGALAVCTSCSPACTSIHDPVDRTTIPVTLEPGESGCSTSETYP